jgi:hypothetical protein
MRRATISLPDALDEAVGRFQRDQDATPSLTAVVQAALHEYLARRGYLLLDRDFWITPAEHGSEHGSLSIDHDEAFADTAHIRVPAS